MPITDTFPPQVNQQGQMMNGDVVMRDDSPVEDTTQPAMSSQMTIQRVKVTIK